jgi:hypothetical protein
LAAIAEMSDGAPAPVDELPVDPDEPLPNGEVPPPDEPPPPGTTTPGLEAALVVVVPAGHTRRPSPAPATTATTTATVARANMGDLRRFGGTGCW